MKFPLLITAAALLAVGAYALTSTTAQDKKPQEAGAGKDEMIPAWMMPGEQHKVLAAYAGNWNFTIKMMDPVMGNSETTGTADMEVIFDGRYLEDVTKSSFQGMPFEGRGFTGFDMIKKKFVTTWFDSMSTGIATLEGTYDAASKTLTQTGEMPDMTGKYVKSRIVQKWTDDDHFTSTFFMPGPDGKETTNMVIEYARAK